MNSVRFALVAAAAAALAPAIVNATPERTALNACASAFASSLAAAGAAPPAFKVIYGGALDGPSTVQFFARSYTFELQARNPKTGLPIARASCSTDARGGVLSLSSIPLDEMHPSLHAQN
jgi:hypothetical protein